MQQNNNRQAIFDSFKGLRCTLPFCHPDYESPTSVQVGELISLLDLSQSDVARLVGAMYTEKGSPTVRRWKADPSSSQYRSIPYAAWRILLEYAGVASTQETRDAVKKYLCTF